MKRYLVFGFHIISATVATFVTGLVVRQLYMVALRYSSNCRRGIDFEVNHFAPAFIAVGIIAGYVNYRRFGGKSAFLVFLIPITILVLRVLTFPSSSIFGSGVREGWTYYFGSPVCSASSLQGLYAVSEQCVSRMLYLGLIYSSVAYSAGAIARHLGILQFQHRNCSSSPSTEEPHS